MNNYPHDTKSTTWPHTTKQPCPSCGAKDGVEHIEDRPVLVWIKQCKKCGWDDNLEYYQVDENMIGLRDKTTKEPQRYIPMEKEMHTGTVLEFIKESNAIEDEFDEESVAHALHAWHYLLDKTVLNHQNIRQAHSLLMTNHLPYNKRGEYRKVNVTVGGHKTPTPIEIVPLMNQWFSRWGKIGLYKKRENSITAHVEFEKIHPCLDGNGRLGRIIMNWQRVKAGVPIIVFTREKRQEYYKIFKDKKSA